MVDVGRSRRSRHWPSRIGLLVLGYSAQTTALPAVDEARPEPDLSAASASRPQPFRQEHPAAPSSTFTGDLAQLFPKLRVVRLGFLCSTSRDRRPCPAMWVGVIWYLHVWAETGCSNIYVPGWILGELGVWGWTRCVAAESQFLKIFKAKGDPRKVLPTDAGSGRLDAGAGWGRRLALHGPLHRLIRPNSTISQRVPKTRLQKLGNSIRSTFSSFRRRVTSRGAVNDDPDAMRGWQNQFDVVPACPRLHPNPVIAEAETLDREPVEYDAGANNHRQDLASSAARRRWPIR